MLCPPLTSLHVYLAGPDVFYPDATERGERKKQILSIEGHIGHFPMDKSIIPFRNDETTAAKIAQANLELMESSSVILACMNPWHGGPSMDVGTALEMGFMLGRASQNLNSILIIGYTEGAYDSNYTRRVCQTVYQNAVTEQQGHVVGADGMSIENFGRRDNLMIEHAIESTGGEVFSSFEEAVRHISRLWAAKQIIPQSETVSVVCTGN